KQVCSDRRDLYLAGQEILYAKSHAKPTHSFRRDVRDQAASRFAGFFDLCDFALTGLRAAAGLSALAAAPGAGPNCARHSGESCVLLRTMQAATRSTSGISEPQSRKASPLQACCCSGV